MTERMTNILGWLVLLAVMLGLWTLFGEGLRTSHIGRNEPLFPNFSQTREEISFMSISDDTMTVPLLKNEGVWAFAEGTVINQDTMKAFLLGLKKSVRREPKIGNTMRGARDDLGVETPISVAFYNQDNDLILAFSVGLYIPAADGTGLTYVLVAGEDKAWLVDALPRIEATPDFWSQ